MRCCCAPRSGRTGSSGIRRPCCDKRICGTSTSSTHCWCAWKSRVCVRRRLASCAPIFRMSSTSLVCRSCRPITWPTPTRPRCAARALVRRASDAATGRLRRRSRFGTALGMAGKKVAAVVISHDESLRMSAEEALARELTSRGSSGIAAYPNDPSRTAGGCRQGARVVRAHRCRRRRGGAVDERRQGNRLHARCLDNHVLPEFLHLLRQRLAHRNADRPYPRKSPRLWSKRCSSMWPMAGWCGVALLNRPIQKMCRPMSLVWRTRSRRNFSARASSSPVPGSASPSPSARFSCSVLFLPLGARSSSHGCTLRRRSGRTWSSSPRHGPAAMSYPIPRHRSRMRARVSVRSCSDTTGPLIYSAGRPALGEPSRS